MPHCPIWVFTLAPVPPLLVEELESSPTPRPYMPEHLEDDTTKDIDKGLTKDEASRRPYGSTPYP